MICLIIYLELSLVVRSWEVLPYLFMGLHILKQLYYTIIHSKYI